MRGAVGEFEHLMSSLMLLQPVFDPNLYPDVFSRLDARSAIEVILEVSDDGENLTIMEPGQLSEGHRQILAKILEKHRPSRPLANMTLTGARYSPGAHVLIYIPSSPRPGHERLEQMGWAQWKLRQFLEGCGYHPEDAERLISQ